MARSPSNRPPVKTPSAKKPVPAAKPVATAAAPAKDIAQAPSPTPPKAVQTPPAAPIAAKPPETPKVIAPASPKPTTIPAPAAPAPIVAAPPPPAPVVKEDVVKEELPVAPPAPVISAAPVAPVPAAAIKAEPLVQPLKAATEKVAETMQESVKMAENITAAGVSAKSAFNDVSDQARAAVEKGSKMIEEFNDFAKGNVEACVAAGRAAAKGAETIGQNAAEYSRKSFEEATKALKSISAAKSPTEFFKLQNDFAKSQFDSMIAEASKVSETFIKIFGDVAEPISSRVAVAADKVKTTIK